MTMKKGFPLVVILLFVELIINSKVEAAVVDDNQAAPATARGAATVAVGGTAPATGGGTVFDITKYGAKPNGDATQGLLAAWKEACASPTPSELLVPAGDYSLGPIKFPGPCNSKVTVNIQGNFKAPADPAKFKGEDAWIKFARIDGLTITAAQGAGLFDGQGAMGWKKNDCVKNPKCSLPYNFRFDFLNNSVVTGITSKDSKFFHINFLGCNHVQVNHLTVDAPADSPNTDGIHIGRSSGINITDTKIGTGDDCISIGDGTTNLNVERVTCGPGHGISIGSLGRYPNEAPVTGITVKSCIFNATDNGIRIKTWHNSYETEVSAVHFEDITVDNVWFPIIVDQEYCPYNHCKQKTPSKVKVSDIKIINVRGTATRKEAVRLVCSSAIPCEKVEVRDVDLQYKGTEPGPASFVCKNIKPLTGGKIVPPPCNAQATTSADEL